MPALFLYLIKANIALTLFYLVYRFGLRRLTFYTLNRYFLLLGIAGAALLPLLDLQSFFDTHRQVANNITSYAIDWRSMQQSTTTRNTSSLWPSLRIIFYTGVFVLFVRFLIQLISLLRIHLQSAKGELNEQKIRRLFLKINPFSFFKNIYINPDLHAAEELQTILAHEQIHVRQWHSLDILSAELQHIFYWFNPGAWLMKRAVRENLEFITDNAILRSGINVKTYQYSLLKATTSIQKTQLANNFNFPHIKQRIMMMNKQTSSRFHLLHYLLILPATGIAMLLVSFSNGESFEHPIVVVAHQDGHTTTVPRTDTTPLVIEKTTIGVVRAENPATDILFNAVSAKKQGNDALLFARLANTNGRQKEEVAVHKKGDKPSPKIVIGPHIIKPAAAATTDTSIIPGRTDGGANNRFTGLFFVDGKKTADINHILPGDIKTVTVLKGKEATAKYGADGKDGVVEITTKAYAERQSKIIFGRPTDVQPLFIINGKMKDSTFSVDQIDKENIYSVVVLKDKAATESYGSKARNGIIKIFTKDYIRKHPEAKAEARHSAHED